MDENPAPSRPPRRRRADGEASREKILDAAAEISSLRGYEGTSIALVSEKCGLPASSIYWHFKDKDALLAAVIERSFTNWLSAWQAAEGEAPDPERFATIARRTANTLTESPDFLRLGLMLALERRPVEPSARQIFLDVRARTHNILVTYALELVPGLEARQAEQLAAYAMAGADGLFIAKEIGGESVDLAALFDLHAKSVMGVATRMASAGADRQQHTTVHAREGETV